MTRPTRVENILTMLLIMILISSTLVMWNLVNKINAGQKAMICILSLDIEDRAPAIQSCQEENGL